MTHTDGLPRYAITGARGRLSSTQQRMIAEVIDALPEGCWVITGACTGVDSYAARYARLSGRRVHTIVPGNRALVDSKWRDWCNTYHEMPPGSDYKHRNAAMVDDSTHGLRGFPREASQHKDSRRSGTWQTIRLGISYQKALRELNDFEYDLFVIIIGAEPTDG